MKLVVLALSNVLLAMVPLAQQARDPGGTKVVGGVTTPLQHELAGKPLDIFPHFRFTRTFNEGEPIRVAFDARTEPWLGKKNVDVFVIDHAELPEFLGGRKLESLRGPPLSVRIPTLPFLSNACTK